MEKAAEESKTVDDQFLQFELTKKGTQTKRIADEANKLTNTLDRCDYFNAVLAFVEQLGQISQNLVHVPIEQRQEKLVEEIERLNSKMPDGLYIPLWHDEKYFYHCIVRVPPENSKISLW